jgi:hypothetical protein
MEEFISFRKIENIKKLFMTITQKIHGTNAQVYIYPDGNGKMQIKAGCRTRYITPENDNFGFARFVYDHQEEFIEKIGEGRHFGEWAGPGINSGEGLKERQLFLFNTSRWQGAPLPDRVEVVPELYRGDFSSDIVHCVFNELKANGSKIVPGYMCPEGIVVQIGNEFYKKVFNPEETGWTSKVKKEKPQKLTDNTIDVSGLLQPIRVEKILSKDEQYVRDYPKSLSAICKAYIIDLEEEGQLTGADDEKKRIKKALGANIFAFVKETFLKQYDVAA